ncbi:MAG TPA: hypothetical protein VGD74_06105 [Vulgatibacter sp.]
MREIERLRAELEGAIVAGDMGPVQRAAERYTDAADARDAAKDAEIARLRKIADVADSFAATVEHAEECREARGAGGQQVPYHGDFSNVNPSAAGRLRWWARCIRAAQRGDA